MAAGAVLPEEDALPGAEAEAAIGKGNDFGGAGEGHFDMTGHIVRAFVSMRKMRVVFGDQAVDKTLQITTCGRICIFHDHQAAAGVAAEDGNRSFFHSGLPQALFDPGGKFARGFARCADFDLFSKYSHLASLERYVR